MLYRGVCSYAYVLYLSMDASDSVYTYMCVSTICLRRMFVCIQAYL